MGPVEIYGDLTSLRNAKCGFYVLTGEEAVVVVYLHVCPNLRFLGKVSSLGTANPLFLCSMCPRFERQEMELND